MTGLIADCLSKSAEDCRAEDQRRGDYVTRDVAITTLTGEQEQLREFEGPLDDWPSLDCRSHNFHG